MNMSKLAAANIELLKHQKEFVHCQAPFPALIGGMGSGKSEALFFRTMALCFKYGSMFHENHLGVYTIGLYEPLNFHLITVIHKIFEKNLSKHKIDYRLNKSESILYLPTLNSKLILRTMENPEKIVGYETADTIIDELDTLSEANAAEIFDRVLSRNRSPKPDGEPNTLAVTTTPEGFKFIYKKWALTTEPDKFVMIKAKTSDNIYMPISYIETLKSQYPANKLAAYLNGEFVNFNGETVYADYDRKLHHSDEKAKDYKELHIGMDFNVGKMSAVIGVIKNTNEGKQCHCVDEIFGVLDTPAMIKEINKKYKGYKIFVYPDASGRNRKSVGAGETDISLLKEHFNVRVRSKNPLVKDRVMNVQRMLLDMDGNITLFINPKCETLMDNLEQQIYDKFGEPDKKNGKDHMLDALGYMLYMLFHKGPRSKVIKTPF